MHYADQFTRKGNVTAEWIGTVQMAFQGPPERSFGE